MNRPSLSSLLVLFLAVFLAGSTAGAQEQPNTANHLYVPWDEYAHENLHVVSVIQDHRTYPKPLAPSLYKIAMSNLLAQSDQDTRIFQFHMGVHRNLVDVRSPNCESFFETAELEWQELDSGGSLRWRVLPPLRCVGMMPKGTSHRFSSGTKFLDFVERCAYAIPERIVPTLLDPTSNALFRIIGAGGSIAFPLHQVLHFPHVRRFIDLKPRPQEGYPTAPWYDPEDPHLSRIVQRTSGDQARDRVAAICTKKYSWTTDDEYWMLWTLDVVGVDHLVIYVSTRDLPMAKVEEAVASHPGLAGRVTLIDMDIPCRGATTKWRETYAYLILSITWDIFVRFQGDFDYAFLIDLDEYIELFDPDVGRVDVKTFINKNRDMIYKHKQLYLSRPSVKRENPNKRADENLVPFLKMLLQDTASHRVVDALENSGFGKAMFIFNATLQPYLHFNTGWPGSKMWDKHLAHILHIREGKGSTMRSFLREKRT